jgi:hypothetical protein
MSVKKYVAGLALSAAVLAPAAARAAGGFTATQGCALAGHPVLALAPYRVTEHIGIGLVERTRGAQFFVQAEPGLTREWLELTARRELANTEQMGLCSLKPGDTKMEVSVASVGSGFWVQFSAPDARSGQKIMKQAEQFFVGERIGTKDNVGE